MTLLLTKELDYLQVIDQRDHIGIYFQSCFKN